MKLAPSQTLRSLAEFLDREFVGDDDHPVTGLNEIHQVEKGDLAFVDHPKYYDKVLGSAASTILIDQKVECPEGKGLIISPDPFHDYNKLTKHFSPFQPWNEKQDQGQEQAIAPSAVIQPGVVLGHNVKVGKNTLIHAGTIVYDNTTIGDNVVIHANSVIGSDAFYFKDRPEGREKLHSCGETIIEDDVEIGALCSIDRGVSGATRIGKGTKMDNQVHIGHDTIIGKDCLFAAQVGISGCVHMGDRVTLWGQVGIVADIKIGDHTVVLGQAALTKDTPGNTTYLGSPAGEARQKFKELASLKKLPDKMREL